MFKAFKQFQHGLTLAKISNATENAARAVVEGRVDDASQWIRKAHTLLYDTTLPRSMIIDYITGWGLVGIQLNNLGETGLADRCHVMSKYLQARFDTGDFCEDF